MYLPSFSLSGSMSLRKKKSHSRVVSFNIQYENKLVKGCELSPASQVLLHSL